MEEHDLRFTNQGERDRYYADYRELAVALNVALGMVKTVFGQFRERAEQSKDDHHKVALMLLSEFVERIDGIVLLTERGSANNGVMLLRSALELKLNILYLFEKPKEYRCRALAYEYFHEKAKLRWLHKCDPSSGEGQKLRAQLVGDNFPDLFDSVVDLNEAKKEEARIKAKMDSPRYAEVRAECVKLKKQAKWYSLWNGPETIKGLATNLKSLAEYESLYSHWSSITHGEGALDRLKNESSDPQPIRSPDGLPSICNQAALMCDWVSIFTVKAMMSGPKDPMNDWLGNYRETYVKPNFAILRAALINKVVPCKKPIGKK